MSQLKQVIEAKPTHDGDGVKIQRIAGHQYNVALDPFLLLDEINSDEANDYVGGFPPHPHRGFETITYMKHGSMRHRDHLGNEGVIHSGGVQWMTAARGIVHSETPEQDSGLLHGFQLWLNLPATEKMKPASYQDYSADAMPVIELDAGGRIVLIAGALEIDGIKRRGVMPDIATRPLITDISLPANTRIQINLEETLSMAVYVYSGTYMEKIGQLSKGQMGIYYPDDTLTLRTADSDVEILLFGGKPIKEPVYQYGPFVMNSREEIDQAIQDYQSNTLTIW